VSWTSAQRGDERRSPRQILRAIAAPRSARWSGGGVESRSARNVEARAELIEIGCSSAADSPSDSRSELPCAAAMGWLRYFDGFVISGW
jgi:hypothetical protein